MNRKIMKNALIVITFLFFTPFCYAQFESKELSSGENIYKIGTVTIRFIPPKGWERKTVPGGGIHFEPSSFEGFIALSIDAYPASGFVGLSEMEIVDRLMQDPTVSNKEIITFAGTKAVQSIDTSVSTKTITFVKSGHIFYLIFLAEKDKFDNLLPAIDQSFKTFEIISAVAPKRKDISANQTGDVSDLLGLADPPADGIYKRDDITIKFIPPSGWKIAQNSFKEEVGLISFTPPDPLEITNLGIMVTPTTIPMYQAPWDTETLKRRMELMKKDKNVESVEIIMFAGVKALNSVSAIGGMKTKQILFFYKGKNMIMLTFVAEEENFDKFLPVVNESIKSFEIVSPTPEYKEEVEGRDLSPSEDLYKKFQSISDKITLQTLKNAKEVGSGEITEDKLPVMVKQGSAELMTRFHDAFVVHDDEAKKIIAGDYNDTVNINNIKNYIDEFTKLEIMPSIYIGYLIIQYDDRTLSNLELEFTARLFKEYLKQVKSTPSVKE